MKRQVTRPYESTFSEAHAFEKGERFAFERRPTEWSGLLWCTGEGDRSGWIPADRIEPGDEALS